MKKLAMPIKKCKPFAGKYTLFGWYELVRALQYDETRDYPNEKRTEVWGLTFFIAGRFYLSLGLERVDPCLRHLRVCPVTRGV